MKLNNMFLAVLGSSAALAPLAAAAMPPAEAWKIGPHVRGRNYSVGMPAHPSTTPRGGITLEFPQRGEIDALTTSVRPLARARQITFRYRIDAPAGARLVSAETPDRPATVSLYFQRRGDNWSGRGRFASYRWYSPAKAVIPLTPGERTVTVRLDETWTNVNGIPNSRDPKGYASALENTGQIGIAFGTSAARSHGVYSTGPARFTLLEFSIT
jgi:hypothetical protein